MKGSRADVKAETVQRFRVREEEGKWGRAVADFAAPGAANSAGEIAASAAERLRSGSLSIK